MSLVEQTSHHLPLEWVSFTVSNDKEGIACISDTVSDAAKNWVDELMQRETIFRNFDILLSRFGGSLTVQGSYGEVNVDRLQQAIAWQFEVLRHLIGKDRDFSKFQESREEFRSACLDASVQITYRS